MYARTCGCTDDGNAFWKRFRSIRKAKKFLCPLHILTKKNFLVPGTLHLYIEYIYKWLEIRSTTTHLSLWYVCWLGLYLVYYFFVFLRWDGRAIFGIRHDTHGVMCDGSVVFCCCCWWCVCDCTLFGDDAADETYPQQTQIRSLNAMCIYAMRCYAIRWRLKSHVAHLRWAKRIFALATHRAQHRTLHSPFRLYIVYVYCIK